ncbi:DUF4136 domain-containing protein [Trinickia terrae]|uniref:DUF4136 domain-containing protein n=1 Tax=Trinickia terrae TaxID=2571161 RepID=A0A4U1I0P5_9BURK|nr:DUF4136 domain-containing protein [Trinickia terrae]TKC86701.1 DUF4136 domain-containing protein [Trinickia terrae]
MKRLLICAALGAAVLPGCADVGTEVRASNLPAAFGGERSYELVRAPSQSDSPLQRQYEALVRDELALHGFASDGGARYLVSLAFDTRSAAVRVASGDCAHAAGGADAACGGPETAAPAWMWPGEHPFVHTLTLRFFERSSGREVYRVFAASRGHDADPARASAYLVKSVFAQFPFADHEAWRVKLHPAEQGAAPGIVSVKPLER